MAAPRKTPEQFAAEMARVASEVELLGAYENARTRVACRCRACGHEWAGVPNHLLRGTGCPRCGGTQRTTDADFRARVGELLPEVEVLDAYVNARTRVACRCRACGHEWSPLPKGLLEGYGCPACGRRASTERLARLNAERQAAEADGPAAGGGPAAGEDAGTGDAGVHVRGVAGAGTGAGARAGARAGEGA